MSNLKQDIPNLAELEAKVGKVIDEEMVRIISSTDKRRKAVTNSQKKQVSSIVGFVLLLILVATANVLLPESLANLLLILALSLGIVSVIYTVYWYREQKAFAQEMNFALIPIIIKILDKQVLYTEDKSHNQETQAILKESLLITDYDSVRADDMYSFFEPYPVTIREIQVQKQVSNGKNSNKVTIFHGVLASVELNKTLTGTTFISTEGDKVGFGHRGFWSEIINSDGIEETELEWNEFERDLHVATNNGIEARYILTPNFMVDLHTWWLEHKQNMRIVFKGNKMLMLLPDTEIKISSCTTSVEPEVLKQYAFSVIKPLWRTLALVEDIKL